MSFRTQVLWGKGYVWARHLASVRGGEERVQVVVLGMVLQWRKVAVVAGFQRMEDRHCRSGRDSWVYFVEAKVIVLKEVCKL